MLSPAARIRSQTAAVTLALLTGACQQASPVEPVAAVPPSECPVVEATQGLEAFPVDAIDDVFIPPCLAVDVSGTARLVVRNQGRHPHTFTVDRQAVDLHLDAGQVGFVDIDLSDGAVAFRCTLHAGMVGVLRGPATE